MLKSVTRVICIHLIFANFQQNGMLPTTIGRASLLLTHVTELQLLAHSKPHILIFKNAEG